MILDHLYDKFGPADEGADYAFGLEDDEVAISADYVEYWHGVNEARTFVGMLTWEGLITEAYHKTRAETDPNLLTDRLLELSALAFEYAESVQRQTNEINAEE